MTVQKFIFPGIIIGILGLLGFTSLLGASRVEAGNATGDVSAVMGVNNPGEGCSINNSYPDAILQWCGLIEQYARQNGLDPNLISAVMLQESSGSPDAYSKSGAVGLLQVMPRDGKAAQFMCKNGPCFADRPTMHELFDPEYNVAYGVQMLAGLIRDKGNLREALRAYGPKDVGYYYADLVLGIMNSHQ